MARTRSSIPFGTRLRRRREEAGFTLRGFAEMIGVSSTYLSQVEQGKYDPPTAERASRIAELFEEDPDEWIGYAGRVPEDIQNLVREASPQMLELIRSILRLSERQLKELKIEVKRVNSKH